MKGFISLHRKLMDNPIWSDPNYLKLWIYCLFEASHKDREQLVGNKIVPLKRGQFVTGRFSLAEEMNQGVKPKQRLSERTWWRHLENLDKWGMLTIKSTNKYSVITVDNYDVYQGSFKQNDQQPDQQLTNKRPTTDQQLTNKRPTTDQQLTTNNNVNNLNNVNKKRKEDGDPIINLLIENNIVHPGGLSQTLRDDLNDVTDSFGFENPEEMIKEAIKDSARGNGRTWKFVYNKLNLWRKQGIKNKNELEFHNQKSDNKPSYQQNNRLPDITPDWYQRGDHLKKPPENKNSDTNTEEQKKLAELMQQYAD